jgi:hypothetical protein
MALPYWEVEVIQLGQVQSERWHFKSALLATCPRCHTMIIVPKSWMRKNKYGTAPCPFCFSAARIPGTKYKRILDR